MVKHTLLFFSFFFASFPLLSQGVLFHANDDLISNRTSYNVFENRSPALKSYLTIQFDLAVLDANDLFGYVCLIKDKNEATAYSVTTHEENDSVYFRLNIDSRKDLIEVPIGKKSVDYWEWHTISIRFQSSKNLIILRIDNKDYTIKTPPLPSTFFPKIVFGKQDNVVDVPKIAIRNLSVEGENKSYVFPLHENEGTVVHDSSGKACGKVSNPIWLINRAYHWTLRQSFFSHSVAAVNFDKKNGRLIMTNRDSIIFYHPTSNQSEVYLSKNKLPVVLHLGMSFMDTLNDRFYVYETYGIEREKPSIAALDLFDFSWNILSNEQLDNYHHHHTGFFDSQKQLYTIFGGFGKQKYSSDFWIYRLSEDKWEEITYSGDKIFPRFFSGEAILDSENALIYGGIGNETGDQNSGKSYFYDCFLVNNSNHTIKKLWNAHLDNTGLVSVRNMVVSEDKKSFYTLCYPEYKPNTFLKLYCFSIQNGSFELLGDSIPMNSERIRTNANLYYDSEAKELYCVTQEFASEDSSRISVYSLSYPPISKSELTGTHLITDKTLILSRIYFIISFIILLLILFIGYRILHKQKTKTKAKAFNTESFPLEKEPKTNSITLFGDFTVKDKSGKDITYLFSPKVKQLFLYILLSGAENGQGVSSSQIDATIWQEKDRENAKNLRGVTLNQIRKILLDITGIELIYNGEYFKLEMQAPLYCDYLECKKDLNTLTSEDAVLDVVLLKIKSIVVKGILLKSVNFDFVRMFRKEFSDLFLSIFFPLLDAYFKEQQYEKVIQITQIIYYIDEINETALRYELELYRKSGMKEALHKRYNTFLVAYKSKTNQDYPYSITELTPRSPQKFSQRIFKRLINNFLV